MPSQMIRVGSFIALGVLPATDAMRAKGPNTAEPPSIHAPAEIEARLIQIAGSRHEMTRVSGTAAWAPQLCVAPPGVFSKSQDVATHGRKMYYLYAMQADAYLSLAKDAAAPVAETPLGQALVKETWIPTPVEELTEAERSSHTPVIGPDMREYVFRERGPVFVMLKAGGDHDWTDDGWVYATLTPDGSRVTTSGRLESCMKCHADAPHDRLFGPTRP